MADRYLHWTNTRPGRLLSRRLGLPRPVPLHRWSAERPVLEGRLILHLTPVPPRGARPGGGDGGGDGDSGDGDAHAKELAAALDGTGLPVRTDASAAEPGARCAAVVVDATGIRDVPELRAVHECLHPVLRSVAACGRIVVLGARPDGGDHHQAAAQQALEGFVRSLAKETGGGRTAQLVRLAPGATPADAASTLRFLLSPKSAYVSGQVIEIGEPVPGAPAPGATAAESAATKATGPQGPLHGRTALVTGSARGIGESVAATLARDGAHVICLDVPQAEADLARVAESLGGTALPLDVTGDDAGARIAEALPADGLDVLVHNAGITRDRKLANMKAELWDQVMEVNLASVLRTTDHLLAAGALRRGTGRIVATASIAGVAGNVGQTNYAASKAGIIGLVRSLAPRAAAEHGVTVNAVAPGFIETKMTAAVPFFIREAGRRMNSHSQGGLPVDVAETTAWLAGPHSSSVNGQIVRVCGQSLLGA
ncbi:3-ketoacyl-ACP reductase [Streptomyces abyssalis]|uniref:3-ketoacyl-ACP reductase n=1 Tax=Streptomyces abyssalis TaxID=933944 RepID=A0A1E7JFB3_9ACTN|nr:3-oxoacyl-ACP reductase [Streptomyces abyssalis]OEU85155.1 3-ketoacyl-ACP reductase [Streptomyces abyssalis]OEU95576.1 3-ketoacyl-ACP reductase [Streptomyces abyssalis]